MAYVEGQRYLRNVHTGAVFQYRASIAGMADIEEVAVDSEGELASVLNRIAPEPEAEADPAPTRAKAASLKTAANRPTMTPVVE